MVENPGNAWSIPIPLGRVRHPAAARRGAARLAGRGRAAEDGRRRIATSTYTMICYSAVPT
eukprot:16009272-Heterocapsa_arctica.AAC.1